MEMNIKRLTPEEFASFSRLIYEASGIFMKDTKITLLSNRLRKRLQALGLNEFAEYYDYLVSLTGDKMKREYESLLDVVSTNETYFFRNEKHFDALMTHCIPEIVKVKKNKKIRIWSAACSTGEEPYTIAICVAELQNILKGWTVEILGTDIALSVLDFAETGEYSGRRIEKVPPEFLKKYFTQRQDEPEVYCVNDDLKKMVKLNYLNFFKDSFPSDIDIIFCRNVMIYFDKEHQQRLIKDFYRVINHPGYLFIGHSETLHMISNDFAYQKMCESPVYIAKPRS